MGGQDRIRVKGQEGCEERYRQLFASGRELPLHNVSIGRVLAYIRSCVLEVTQEKLVQDMIPELKSAKRVGMVERGEGRTRWIRTYVDGAVMAVTTKEDLVLDEEIRGVLREIVTLLFRRDPQEAARLVGELENSAAVDF